MFDKNTVFILGAGASWHYGYPTGKDLIKEVVKKAKKAEQFFNFSIETGNNRLPQYMAKAITAPTGFGSAGLREAQDKIKDAWDKAKNACHELQESLTQVNPPVIDYFLGQNPSLQEIGKMLIAWVILECESITFKEKGNLNHRKILENSPDKSVRDSVLQYDVTKHDDDWYRFIIHKLVSGCAKSESLLENKVTFITFNYDTSLEWHLYHSLRRIEWFKPEDIEAFLREPRILHVYGKAQRYTGTSDPKSKISTPTRDSDNPSKYFEDYKQFLDNVYEASKGIQTIAPDGKGLEKGVIKLARTASKQAENVYILGYGFDDMNNKVLDLLSSLGLDKNVGRNKRIMFTNYGDINRINKRAGKLLLNSFNHFTDNALHGVPHSGHYCEKSIRDVYGALEVDFDSPEEELAVTSPDFGMSKL